MLVKSPTTVMLELGGLVAGVTLTVRSVEAAGSTELGVALPIPEGTVGSPPQDCAGDELLRGIGPKALKSAWFTSVSMQPFPLRTAAVVLLKVGDAPEPSKQFALPYPTRS